MSRQVLCLREGEHLPDDLSRREVPCQTQQARKTETAVHRAAYLAGNAERSATFFGHVNGLNGPAVLEPKDVTDRAIARGDPLPDFGVSDRVPVREEDAKGFVEIGQAAEIGLAPGIDGVVNLPGTVARLPAGLQPLRAPRESAPVDFGPPAESPCGHPSTWKCAYQARTSRGRMGGEESGQERPST